jgi:hypothetical protein
MSATSIGTLFGKFQASVDDVLDLQQPLSAGAFEKQLSLDTGTKTLTLFDTPVTIDATLEASVSISKAGDVPDSPFGATPLILPAGEQYTALTIGGKISAAANVKATPGVLAISGSASVGTTFSYTHLRPILASRTRLEAFTELGSTTNLPQLVDITTLTQGETLDFAATLNVDLGLTAKYGTAVDITGVIGLIQDLGNGAFSLPFNAHIGFTASAAFGFSLYESVHLTTGRAATTTPNWVRIRLERQHRTRLAFGIALDLTIAYDATAGATALLDKAFALVPKLQTIETLKKIAALPQDWNAFKSQIENEAADVVGRLVNETHWKDALAASPEVATLIETANKVVKAYDGIDDKVKSVVEEVLGRLDSAGLDKVRPIIAQIAAIDPATFDVTSLLGGQAQEVVHWIEVLTGQDIEELLITGNVKKELVRAVDAAKKLQAFLTGGAANDILARIHALLDRSGATGLVAWLKKNATSVADLQAAGDKAVGDFVRRLVGKELDKISPDDVKKIQDFAAKLETILSAPDKLKEKLQNGITKLKGTIGFSASAEISRVSEWSALVDVELDPTNAAAVKAAQGLSNGQVVQFLTELSQIDPKVKAYLIHEILLTSRRVRTSTATTLLAFLNFSLSEQESAIDETSIAVRDDGQGPIRDALYSGGAAVQRKVDTTTAEGAAWIRMPAAGTGTDVEAPYSSVSPVIRLTYVRENTLTSKESRESVFLILGQLSFASALAGVPQTLVGQQTRFSLEVEFGGDAVQALKKNAIEAEWNGDYLTAAHRWFSDVDRTSAMEAQSGQNMAAVVLNPEFRKVWTDFLGAGAPGDTFVQADRSGKFGLELLETMSNKFRVEYRPLDGLMGIRSHSFGHFSDFEAAKASSLQPDDLVTVSREAADLFRTGQTGWNPPMFNFWFVLARLFRLDPNVFKTARAVATIQSRQNGTDDWSAKQLFAMTNGVSTANLQLS